MSDVHARTVRYVAPSQIPPSPPPAREAGAVKWLRENLFSSWLNSLLTILSAIVVFTAIPPLIQWAFLDAVWSAASLDECRAIAEAQGHPLGACGAVINERFPQFLFGFSGPRKESLGPSFASRFNSVQRGRPAPWT